MLRFQLWFIGIPLLVIAIPALITTIRQHSDRQSRPIQMFFFWQAAYSMLIAGIGMLSTIIVSAYYSMIPGTASDGGNINGKYYFNWHDQTYTEVPQLAWERAWFLEQMSQHLLWVPFVVFGTSFVILFFRPNREELLM